MNLPTLGGFELESRSERSDVTTGPAAGRTSTWELKLRATVPGEWRLGPIHVRQGSSYSMGDPVTVTIEGGAPAPVTATLSRRLRRPDPAGPASGRARHRRHHRGPLRSCRGRR